MITCFAELHKWIHCWML